MSLYKHKMMNLLRLFHTISYLKPSQIFARFYCRSKFFLIQKFPIAYISIEKLYIKKISDKDFIDFPNKVELLKKIDLSLLSDKNSNSDYFSGSISYLGRRVEFGSYENIDWELDLDERNNPLWVMTLSYLSVIFKMCRENGVDNYDATLAILKSFDFNARISTSGSTRAIWHPYSSSHRIINLLSSYLCLSSEERSENYESHLLLREKLLDEAKRNLAYVLLNMEYDLQFNHLLKNLVAIWYAKRFFNNIPISERKLIKLTMFSINQNFLTDGGHVERSPMYHNLGVLDLMLLYQVLPVGELKNFVEKKLETASKASLVMSHINGDFALYNDSWRGGAPSIMDILEPSPQKESSELLNTGYVKLLDKHQSIIFDVGDPGPSNNLGHAHSDFLAYEITTIDGPLICDFGTPTYSCGDLRYLCRSAAVHNGPKIKGVEPMECWDSFKVGRRPKVKRIDLGHCGFGGEIFAFAGTHDGYSSVGVIVGRMIIFYPGDGLAIIDVWIGDVKNSILEVGLISPYTLNKSMMKKDFHQYIFTDKRLGSHEDSILFVENVSTIEVDEIEMYPDFGMSSFSNQLTFSPIISNENYASARHYFSFNGCSDLFLENIHNNNFSKKLEKYTELLLSTINKSE